MGENKNLDSLRNELEHKKLQMKQAEHQLQRKQNQLSYRENFSRREEVTDLLFVGQSLKSIFL